MKITAEFENVDFAERAANKLKHSIDNISKIIVYSKSRGSDDLNFGYVYPTNPANIAASYATYSNNISPAMGGPMVGYYNSIEPPIVPQFSESTYLSVYVDEPSGKYVSSILTSYGGLNINLK